jgi:histidinol dehydrogenase
MIPILRTSNAAEQQRVQELLNELRLDAREVAVAQGGRAKAVKDVEAILSDVAQRGDEAVVESARKFDDPDFEAEQIRVPAEEMKSAAARVSPEVMAALRRSIAQVREYQTHIMPTSPATSA